MVKSAVSFHSLHLIMFLWIDKVFRGDCTTRQVYEEGAKDIALSVVNGINCKYNPHFLSFCMNN